jgi:4,5-DOPA dioxygenase extradiol
MVPGAATDDPADPATVMPAAFLGHGNPMNALEHNRYTEAWRAFGASVPRPRAILVISAHWFVGATLLTAMARPRTIHDFYGFPPALFDVRYPAPGSPEVAAEIAEVARPSWIGLDADGWGLDHGTWSVLVHAFPEADVPVLQLSVNAFEDYDTHFTLGVRLAELRRRGILVVGSGNIVHNLALVDFSVGETAADWAVRFDQAAVTAATTDPETTRGLVGHPDYRLAVPTPDHFLPLAPIAGLAAVEGRPLTVLVGGYLAGSLSMTALRVD